MNTEVQESRQHPEFTLSDGDRVEVVHAIGGG